MAGWLDYHSDWTTSDDLILAADSVLAACIAAGKERWMGVKPQGINPPTDAAWAAQWDAYFPVLMSRESAWDTLLTRLSGMLSASVTAEAELTYVNHLDNGGVWNGLTNIPSWTETTIATAAGLPAWPDVVRLGALSTELPWSVRKIIDLMLWTFAENSRGLRETSTKLFSEFFFTWADAVTAFNAGAFSAWNFGSGANHSGGVFDNLTQISRRRRRAVVGSTAAYNKTIDAYALFEDFTWIYDNQDYPGTVDTYERYLSETVAAAILEKWVTVGDINDASVNEPANNTRRGWIIPLESQIRDRFVAKWNVTGGFEFVA